MRAPRRSLRQFARELRWPAEERRMEARFEAERTPAVLYAERERA
jgi:hypothetical protein